MAKVWVQGRTGSGKTLIAEALMKNLEAKGLKVNFIDDRQYVKKFANPAVTIETEVLARNGVTCMVAGDSDGTIQGAVDEILRLYGAGAAKQQRAR